MAVNRERNIKLGKMQEHIDAPRGTELSCKSWQQEAALRMLMNNLDPDVAEAPEELIVYSSGKAARTWKDYCLTVQALKSLENYETLIRDKAVQSSLVPHSLAIPELRVYYIRRCGRRMGSPICHRRDGVRN